MCWTRGAVKTVKGSSRSRAGLACLGVAVLAVAGFLAALAIRPPLAGAQSTEPLQTTTDPLPTTTSPSPDPTPDPAPKPSPGSSPTPTPTTSEGATSDNTGKHRTRHRHHRHHRHKVTWQAPAHGPRVERAHAPLDVPVYGDSTSVGAIQLASTERSSGGSRQIAPILMAVLGAALFLVTLLAMPTRSLAGVSQRLLMRRSQVALTGLTILSGIAIGVVVVLLGS